MNSIIRPMVSRFSSAHRQLLPLTYRCFASKQLQEWASIQMCQNKAMNSESAQRIIRALDSKKIPKFQEISHALKSVYKLHTHSPESEQKEFISDLLLAIKNKDRDILGQEKSALGKISIAELDLISYSLWSQKESMSEEWLEMMVPLLLQRAAQLLHQHTYLPPRLLKPLVKLVYFKKQAADCQKVWVSVQSWFSKYSYKSLPVSYIINPLILLMSFNQFYSHNLHLRQLEWVHSKMHVVQYKREYQMVKFMILQFLVSSPKPSEAIIRKFLNTFQSSFKQQQKIQFFIEVFLILGQFIQQGELSPQLENLLMSPNQIFQKNNIDWGIVGHYLIQKQLLTEEAQFNKFKRSLLNTFSFQFPISDPYAQLSYVLGFLHFTHNQWQRFDTSRKRSLLNYVNTHESMLINLLSEQSKHRLLEMKEALSNDQIHSF